MTPPPKFLLVDLLNEILEKIAYGEDIRAVAHHLCRKAEAYAPEAICSILLIDHDGKLRPLAGPSLPSSYSAAIDGLAIGPATGSCGTAAFLGEAVEVQDIENDVLWADYKGLALPFGLRACWATPIKARDGRVVGTFAFYYRRTRGPSEYERQIVDRCTHLCAVMIENAEARRLANDLAFIDALSKLPNRASFDRRLDELVTSQSPFALVFADLDHLKLVNDTLGHAAGDELIRIVGSRLRDLADDIEAFRLGGDEFAFIVRDCPSEDEMAAAADAVMNSVRLPVEHAGLSLVPSLTAGGVYQGSNGAAKSTVYQNADFALYHAKEVNRGGFVPFRPGMRTTMNRRLSAIAKLEAALNEGRVVPHYQPVVRLDTAEIIGLEALARIVGRDGRFDVAGSFHRALSDPRLAYALTGRMLTQVAADIRQWLDLGLPIQHVGLNITTGDLRKGDFDRRVADAFAAAQVPLKHLILEINESVYVNDEAVPREIKNLRAMGMRVALDDFGTGYASLTNLLDFPVDIIKIDKSFVDRIASDHSSAVIVEALLEVARKLDIRIVAEGVETKEQSEKLLAMGCRLAQGYYFARPAPSATTIELLKRFAQRIGGPAPSVNVAARQPRQQAS